MRSADSDPQSPTGPRAAGTSRTREARWFAENGDDLRRFLVAVALPQTIEPLDTATRELATCWFGVFEQCVPPITGIDVMGLIVLRLTQEFLPEGPLTPVDGCLANLKALSLARKAAPQRMLAAGFTAPEIVLPYRVSECVVRGIALRVRQRWIDWCRDVLDPYRPPSDERELVVRGLANLKCYRQTKGGRTAARKAKNLLDADLRDRGHGGANLEPEDIVQELYTLGPGCLGEKILRLREDGFLAYRPRAMRDIVRKVRHGASVKPEAMRLFKRQMVAARRRDPRRGWRDIYVRDASEWDQARDEDPASSLELAELWDRLLEECDDVDRFIVEHWDECNAEIGRRLKRSGPAIGKRRKRILGTGKRLMGLSG